MPLAIADAQICMELSGFLQRALWPNRGLSAHAGWSGWVQLHRKDASEKGLQTWKVKRSIAMVACCLTTDSTGALPVEIPSQNWCGESALAKRPVDSDCTDPAGWSIKNQKELGSGPSCVGVEQDLQLLGLVTTGWTIVTLALCNQFRIVLLSDHERIGRSESNRQGVTGRSGGLWILTTQPA